MAAKPRRAPEEMVLAALVEMTGPWLSAPVFPPLLPALLPPLLPALPPFEPGLPLEPGVL